MTGSSFSRRAASVRSRQYLSSAWYFASGFSSVIRWLPRTEVSAERSASRVAPAFRSSSPAFPPASDANARRKCSAETYSSLNASASSWALRNSGSSRGDSPRDTAPLTFGSCARRPSASASSFCAGTPVRARSSPATPPSCRSRAANRCSPSTCECPLSEAVRTASWSASCDFTVSLSIDIIDILR